MIISPEMQSNYHISIARDSAFRGFWLELREALPTW
jgi:hypothetical protein